MPAASPVADLVRLEEREYTEGAFLAPRVITILKRFAIRFACSFSSGVSSTPLKSEPFSPFRLVPQAKPESVVS